MPTRSEVFEPNNVNNLDGQTRPNRQFDNKRLFREVANPSSGPPDPKMQGPAPTGIGNRANSKGAFSGKANDTKPALLKQVKVARLLRDGGAS